jgi:CRISPR-associated protein (TIGR03986 family)
MRSPYYFVPQVDPKDPMRKHNLPVVVCPDWGPQASHDIPFSNGISGWIDLMITNKTPLFIRDSLDRDSHYKTPGGAYAIPGTSIRGMIRNVFEIATFSRLQFMNKHRYSVRDLHNRNLYTGHMTRTVGSRTFQPSVMTGWMRRNAEGKWQIQPCEHWRVESTRQKTRQGRADLESTFGCHFGRRVVNVSDRYDELGPNGQKPIWFTGDEQPRPHSHSRNSQIIYKAVHSLSQKEQEGHRKGWVILTGRPMDRKHMDFVFEESDNERRILVSDEQMADFQFIHSDGAEQHSDTPRANNARQFWESRYESLDDSIPGIPVFYLLDDGGGLRSFGLAQMFKLAYNNSPKELNDAYLEAVDADPDLPDFAEAVFGHVREESSTSNAVDGLRGRVTFETAISGDAQEGRAFPAILGSPKASYYPAYVRQNINNDGCVNGDYKTYMDDNAQISGWKRYQQKPFAKPPAPNADQKNVTVFLKPLQAGATFHTRMFVHNLHPEELGGLLWSLDFGGNDKCRHQMGMGRPFGMGGVTVSLGEHKLKNVVSGERLDEQKLQGIRDEFIAFMNDKFCGEWKSSEQILDLIALATPGGGRADEYLDYMRLSPNEFVDAIRVREALPGPRPIGDARRCKEERWQRMQDCVQKKAEEHKAKQEEKARRQAEAQRLREEQEAAKERERLLGLTPGERIKERCESLDEGELWQLVQQVFPDGHAEPLLGQLELPAEPEVNAFREWVMQSDFFADWVDGRSAGEIAGKSKLKSVYAIVTGEEQVDYSAMIKDVSGDTGKLQKLLALALDENWPDAAREEFVAMIKTTLKGGKKWKKNKQATWKDAADKLKG